MLYRPFENQLNIELNKHNLHRAQWTILYYLYHFGEATNIEISHYQGVEKPTITRTLASLEKLGYVQQARGKDKREKRMQLTDSGRNMYEHVRITIDELEADILQGISETEQREAIRIMETIRSNIRK
ncbi:MarR family transcriptional regulator [Virgibacillus sp. NKC19-3]|nr:MarR family transcriptional regulator [Virgibacillus sp. NKC19-3]